MVTYDSGADGHYLSEADRHTAGLPILKPSTKQVGVANGSTSHSAHVTRLPFPTLSPRATQADSFNDCPHSLMSIGKTSDDKTASIFTRDGVTVHAEEDVLITCQGTPILIGVCDAHGRYCIPLIQTHRHCPPQCQQHLRPPINQTGHQMVTCRVRLPRQVHMDKAIKAGNFHGWPLLTAMNVLKYYPETIETPKGHLNQTRKNVCSTKPKHPFEELHSNQLRGCKECDIYTKVYDTRETIFTNQTGKFPTRSQTGHQYIMIMVKIDSSAILVEPIKNQKDA
eukprot:CCRYP_018185-RA/>CCRYP_018185-RA protein AED:0.33 eAED:0.35 QI:0/0/0/1/0/0/2/0/281